MATILDLITVGNKTILVVDADPATAGGTSAELSSLAMLNSSAKIYIKYGASLTQWRELISSSGWISNGSDASPIIVGNQILPLLGVDFEKIYIQSSGGTVTVTLPNAQRDNQFLKVIVIGAGQINIVNGGTVEISGNSYRGINFSVITFCSNSLLRWIEDGRNEI